MISKIYCKDYNTLKNTIAEHESKSGTPLFVLFTGGKDQQGKSWCPDCNQADPVIECALSEVKKDLTIIVVDVGTKEFWKDKSNAYRVDKDLSIKSIPTLIKIGSCQRLEEGQLFDVNTVNIMFEDL